jgi:hypothetical protein
MSDNKLFEEPEEVKKCTERLRQISKTRDAVLMEVLRKEKEMEEMIETLTENSLFLKAMASKLGIPESALLGGGRKKKAIDKGLRMFGPAVPPLIVNKNEGGLRKRDQIDQKEEKEVLKKYPQKNSNPTVTAASKFDAKKGHEWRRLKNSAMPRQFITKIYETRTSKALQDMGFTSAGLAGKVDPSKVRNYLTLCVCTHI